MTTIAYRDGVMAADTLMSRGDECAYGVTKIAQTEFFTVGMAGSYVNLNPFISFLSERIHSPFDSLEDLWRHWDDVPSFGSGFAALVVNKQDGSIWNAMDDAPPVRVPREFEAVGSGGAYAMGAMASGASAMEAVKAARLLDMNTGGDIIRVRVNG